jgi:23S rRNA pseudouridine1911/1915/1917 synthase
MERLTAEVPFEMAGMRLDQALSELFADYSRTKLQTWVKLGRVKVNGLTLWWWWPRLKTLPWTSSMKMTAC